MTKFVTGARVRIQGLVGSKEHNGKVGEIAKAAAPSGRVAVKLADGKFLSVKTSNLEVVESSDKSGQKRPNGDVKERTLKRDNALLREFHGSQDPNVFALYYHFRDREFDCFNVQEYETQMIRYYESSMKLVLVVPRKILDRRYTLVCLQHSDHAKNTLCEVAFNSGRSFAGISMLIKENCFACNKPNSEMCTCKSAFFCSPTCRETTEAGKRHTKLCNLIDTSSVIVEKECLQLIE